MNNTNSKQNLWVASEYFYPEYSAATGYFLTGIAEKLSEKYRVNVVTASTNKSNRKNIRKENWNSINIFRLRGTGIDKNNLILRSIKFIYLSIQFFFILLFKCGKKSKLCVVTNPAPLVVLGAIIAKLKHIEYSIIVHDIFPENLVGANIISSKSLIYKAILPIYNWSYSQADLLISMGSDMNVVLRKKLPSFNRKIDIIPNWADTSNIKVSDKKESPILRKMKIEDKIIFTFAGNIGRAQSIPELIAGIKNVSSENAHFLFFGDGAFLNHVLVAEDECENINYAGSFPRSEKHIFLTASDIALISLSIGMTGLGVPSKTYDYLAAGRPILVFAELTSEIAQLVTAQKIGWVCPPNDLTFFNKTINYIIGNPTEILEFGKNARKVAEVSFSKHIILNKYLQSI